MKLFFETAGQAQAFLAAVPLGLVLAACLDASVLAGPLRPLADVLMMLTAGFALIFHAMRPSDCITCWPSSRARCSTPRESAGLCAWPARG